MQELDIILFPCIAWKDIAIDSALEKLKAAHKSQDVAQIDSAIAEMNTAWAAASEEMYKSTQDQPGAEQNGQQAGQEEQHQGAEGGDNVTDAEFEEVK